MNPIRIIDEFADRAGRRLSGHGRVGIAIWLAGTACDVALLSTLAIDVARRPSTRSISRLVVPLGLERALVHGVGPLIDRDRPASRFRRPADLAPSSSSLPSGHTSNAFAASTLLAPTERTWLVTALAVGAATSRVLLRVHRVSDVVVSAAAGILAGRAMNRWTPDPSVEDHLADLDQHDDRPTTA